MFESSKTKSCGLIHFIVTLSSEIVAVKFKGLFGGKRVGTINEGLPNSVQALCPPSSSSTRILM